VVHNYCALLLEALFFKGPDHPIIFSDHILDNLPLRVLLRGFIKQATGNSSDPIGTVIVDKWRQSRRNPRPHRPPELLLTGADITVHRQTVFALADAATLEAFATRQLFVVDLTEDATREPNSPYVLYPQQERQDVLLDATFTSSAFPVAFPTKKWILRQQGLPKPLRHVFVDGGLCNNSPIDLAAFAGATHIISIEFTPFVERWIKLDDPSNYNIFTVVGPLLETSMASALRNNISSLVASNAGQEGTKIYRLAPLPRPFEPIEPEGIDPTPGLLDFGGRYDQDRGRPGRLLMNLYDWFMQGYLDCMGYASMDQALSAGDPVVQDYHHAEAQRGYRKNVIFGNKFWETGTSAWPDELPSPDSISPLLKVRSFQSVNFPQHFLRHQNWLLEITEIKTELDQFDASFEIVPGLADINGVSFQSVNYPGHYVRHSNFRLRIDKPTDEALFKADATFHIEAGLADPTKSSFRSHNFPDRYIRHRNFHVFLDPKSEINPHYNDATFNVVKPFKQ
jgi:hypothetical protein